MILPIKKNKKNFKILLTFVLVFANITESPEESGTKQKDACVAQLDRASGYGPEGRGFESCRTHYLTGLLMQSGFFFFKKERGQK